MKLIKENTGIGPDIQIQIIKTIIIILIMSLIYSSLKRILYKVIDDTKIYYRTKKITSYIMVLFSMILIGRIWFLGVSSVTTFVGLFSAGVAIAMKDLIMNIAGWGYILSRTPFRVGDRIEIEGVSGDVIDIKLFDFTLMEIGNWINADESTGRRVTIPNRDIFNNPLFNYSQGIPYIWSEIEIGITFESNWRIAKTLLQEIANKHGEKISKVAEESFREAAKNIMILHTQVEPTVYTASNDNGVMLTIRYMCCYNNRRSVKQKIWEDVLTAFEKHSDIEFSYPTQRVYYRPGEFKHKEEKR